MKLGLTLEQVGHGAADGHEHLPTFGLKEVIC
jgi:hypothetical protein